jgi:hypothetical protein
MTDEKKPADLDAGGAETGSQAPDESRRKLAKAALASPVIMTLLPRSVLGGCNVNALSVVLHSATPVNNLIASLAARPDLTEDDLLDCSDCSADYDAVVATCNRPVVKDKVTYCTSETQEPETICPPPGRAKKP